MRRQKSGIKQRVPKRRPAWHGLRRGTSDTPGASRVRRVLFHLKTRIEVSTANAAAYGASRREFSLRQPRWRRGAECSRLRAVNLLPRRGSIVDDDARETGPGAWRWFGLELQPPVSSRSSEGSRSWVPSV